MTKLEEYQKVLDELSNYSKTMQEKYKIPKWDETCTEEEWQKFIELVRKKDKLEAQVEKEENED